MSLSLKCIAGSLNTPGQTAELTVTKGERQQNGDHLNIKVPKSIEEVPFRFTIIFERNLKLKILLRRQDIRILIAKNRRMMDRYLIQFFGKNFIP